MLDHGLYNMLERMQQIRKTGNFIPSTDTMHTKTRRTNYILFAPYWNCSQYPEQLKMQSPN